MTETRQEPTFYGSARPYERAPRRRRNFVGPIAVALLLALAAAAGWFWLWDRQGLPTQASTPRAFAPAQQGADTASSPMAKPMLQPPRDGEVVKANQVASALQKLLGRDAVLKLLDTTDFPRRLVATLDNLGREHAPVLTWPVQPSPGRFLVEADGSSHVIAAANALRYWPFVALARSVDAAQAVDLYRRMYPTLEEAYRELGLAKRPLHDRVLEVIDLLLATPDPLRPPRIALTQVKGPIPSVQPWTRYEYADPRLQRLTAGQKILLRMGPDNRQALKLKLEELRQELLRASQPARS